MKLYIATIANHAEYEISHECTLVATSANELASKVYDYLSEEIPVDLTDLVIECSNGNQHGEPLSQGVDTDLCHEYLLFTSIQEV